MLRLYRFVRSPTAPRSAALFQEGSVTEFSSEALKKTVDDCLASEVAFNEKSSISRYLPSEQMAFLVEDRRLTGSERVSQKVSSFLPWFLLGAFAISPFFVMKYNLQRLSSDHESAKAVAPANYAKRSPITHARFSDIPDLIQRRIPSIIYMYDDSFHSRVMLLLFRELDHLLDKHNIAIGISLIPHSSATHAFRQAYPVGPMCQFLHPGNGSSVVDFEGPWNARNLLEFVISPSQITPSMLLALESIESKLGQLRRCLFRRRFIEKDIRWLTEDSLEAASVEDALVRCETMK